MIYKYRNTEINSDVLENYTEDEFREIFKSIVDVEEACKELKKYFKQDVQKTKTSSRKRKKTKSEDTF